MIIEQMPQAVRGFYPTVLWRGKKNEKCIYLTFDDGPTEENTMWILRKLDDFGIKATFFCIGKNAEEKQALFEEIKRRGHCVGSHGYSHVRGLWLHSKEYFSDIRKAASIIKSKLYRPPHGRIRPVQALYLSRKYKIVLWDVITRDYDRDLRPEDVYQIAVKYGRNGSIVVFHDSVKARTNMRYAFPKAVEYWKAQGFEFKTLDDLSPMEVEQQK